MLIQILDMGALKHLNLAHTMRCLGRRSLKAFWCSNNHLRSLLVGTQPQNSCLETRVSWISSSPSKSAVPFLGRVDSQLDSVITRVGPTHRRSPSRLVFTCRCMAFLDEPIKSEIRCHPAALCSYRILH